MENKNSSKYDKKGMSAIFKITLLKICPFGPQHLKVQGADDPIHHHLYYNRVALLLGAVVPCPCL